MFETISNWLFGVDGLTPHGFCLLWQPGLIWTYAISDVAIALAYFSIPVALSVIARRRRDLVFRPLLWLFAAFILLCGTTHWLELITLWVPLYGIEGVVKATTATVSVFTAIALWRLLPLALTFPSPAQMREANAALRVSEEALHQARKMETVGQLTGGIAHDFNNVLQVIASGLNLMERRLEQGRVDEVQRYIPPMRQAADGAASITSRLLAFSRRQNLRPSAVEPDEMLTGMAELIRSTLGPSIDFRIRPRDGKWSLFCDGHQLENALLNLIINARDAMPNGGMLLVGTADRTLSAADVSDPQGATPGNYVELEVKDTGEGMTPDVLQHVFEPFFTTKPLGKGTGLGLSQVYGFVKQSGGFVRIDSEPGAGTTVRLFLPAFEKDAKQPAKVAPTMTAGLEAGAAKAVLVVEDQDSVRAQIVETLTEMGCTVTEAKDGTEGLRAVQSGETFDLLITDVGMPGLNGRQLADAAQAIKPGLPILLITGFAGAALDNLEAEAGMSILQKPFALPKLVERVSAMLNAGEPVK